MSFTGSSTKFVTRFLKKINVMRSFIRDVKIQRYTSVYLDTWDTDHKICISYHAKLISLYYDTHFPLQTYTMGDLQDTKLFCCISAYENA